MRKKIVKYKRVNLQKPQIMQNEIVGQIIYIDKFGNAITNISRQTVEHFRQEKGKEKIHLHAGGKDIASFQENYSSAKKKELIFLPGSVGLIEIAVREGSASQRLSLKPGDEVKIGVKTDIRSPRR